MVSECAGMIKTAVPAIRIAVARLLKSKYRMGQLEIARGLGVTQASVNKYLNGRYSRSIGGAMASIRGKGLDRRIAKMVVSGISTHLVNESIDRAASSMPRVRG